MWKRFKCLLAAGLIALLGGCVYGPDYGYVRADGYYGDAWYGSGYYGSGYYGSGYYGSGYYGYGPSYYGWYVPSYYYYGYPAYGSWGGYYGRGYRGRHWDGGSYPDYHSRSRDYPGSPRPPGYSGSTSRGQPPMAGGSGRRAAPPVYDSPAWGRSAPSSTPPRNSNSRAPRPSSRTRDR
jgi:hypothetical protein